MVSELPPLHERTIPRIWLQAVQRDPGAPFLLFRTRTYSYGEAAEYVESARQQLESDGVARGTHIAVLFDNCPEYVWVVLALARIGAVAVPIHAEARGQLLTHLLTSSKCQMAIVADTYVDRVREAIGPDALSRAWILHTDAGTDADAGTGVDAGGSGESPTRISAWQRDIEFGRAFAADYVGTNPDPSFKDTMLLMFTSGTSGPSKAAIVAQAHPVTAATAHALAAGITADDRMHTCLPLSHANAMWFTLYAAITQGASVALYTKFSVRGFWRDIVDSGATQTSLLGSMLQLLWKREATAEEQVKKLKSLFVVPFPTNPQDYEDRFGAKLMTLYGMSEWTPVSISRPGEGYGKAPGMAGPLRRDLNDVAILDDDDLPLPVGKVGEIAVRRHEPFTSFQGYFGREAETLRDWRNLWFHTGDHGYIGEDDFLYYVGRKSDSLRRRGENVSAGELEDLLLACLGIKEVAVVAVPSDLGDISEDDIAIYVVPRDADVTVHDVVDFARENLARYMNPRYVKLVDDLPRTATSKIRKDVLRKEARDTLATFHDAQEKR